MHTPHKWLWPWLRRGRVATGVRHTSVGFHCSLFLSWSYVGGALHWCSVYQFFRLPFGFSFLAIVHDILSSHSILWLLICVDHLLCVTLRVRPPALSLLLPVFLALLGSNFHNDSHWCFCYKESSRILEVKVKWRLCLSKLWRSQAREKIMIYLTVTR